MNTLPTPPVMTIRRPFDYDAEVNGTRRTGHVAAPVREALRLWLLLDDANHRTREFRSWLEQEEDGAHQWAVEAAADLAGVPWLLATLAGFIDVEVWHALIATAQARAEVIAHPVLDEFGPVPPPVEFLADVCAAIADAAGAAAAFAEAYRDHKPADSTSMEDNPTGWAARLVYDMRGGARIAIAATDRLRSVVGEVALAEAYRRLTARLSRCDWLAAMAAEVPGE